VQEPPEPIASLIRDHRVIEEVVGDARAAIRGAVGTPDDAENAARALEAVRDLEAFMVVDVTIHIAKEEHVIFPAIRARAEETTGIIEDLVAQHDEIRAKHALLQQVLDALDEHSDEVASGTADLSACLRAAENGLTPDVLKSVRDAVDRLDWILEGHFLDEEENLFEPSADWFSPDELAEMAERMENIEAAMV
jgi:hemerythrin-like domain-containing protein